MVVMSVLVVMVVMAVMLVMSVMSVMVAMTLSEILEIITVMSVMVILLVMIVILVMIHADIHNVLLELAKTLVSLSKVQPVLSQICYCHPLSVKVCVTQCQPRHVPASYTGGR